MQILQTIILILFIICCFILILLVLMQSGKGGGLNLVGGANTGMQPSSMDAITKITWVAGISFFIFGILAAIVFADTGPKIDGNKTSDSLSLPLESIKKTQDTGATEGNSGTKAPLKATEN